MTEIAKIPETDRKVYGIVDMAQAEKALKYAGWAVENKVAPKNITAAEYYMLILAGNDLGMTLMEINNSLCIVNGRVTIWGPEVIARVNRAGFNIKWVDMSDTMASAIISGPNRKETHKEQFSIEDAKRAGLLSKDPWMKYPKDMLKWKVVARLVRNYCPEVIGGYYMKEDYEADVTLPKKSPKKPDMARIQQPKSPEETGESVGLPNDKE